MDLERALALFDSQARAGVIGAPEARVAEARRMGLRYLVTEARATSRPTLERMGFTPAGPETTWLLTTT